MQEQPSIQEQNGIGINDIVEGFQGAVGPDYDGIGA